MMFLKYPLITKSFSFMFLRKAIQLKMLSLDSYYKVGGQRYKKLIALHLKGHLVYSVKYLIF